MSAGEDGIVRYDVTRIALVDALAALPTAGYLTLEVRAKMADSILGQLPEASPLVTEEHAREIMQATVAEGIGPIIDAELAKVEAAARASERERLAKLAEANGAVCLRQEPCGCTDSGCVATFTKGTSFADLIREQS